MIPRTDARTFPSGWGWKPPRPKVSRKPRPVRHIPDEMLALPLAALVKDLQAAWGIKKSQAYNLACKRRKP
jgi:hypothetical protein